MNIQSLILAQWTRIVGSGHHNPAFIFAVLMPGLLVLLLVIKALSATPGGSGDSGWVRRLVAVALLVVTLPTSFALVSSFVTPHIQNPSLNQAAAIGLPLLVLLTAGIPLMGWLLRTKYPVTLVSTATGLFACIVTILVVNAILASFDGGNRELAHMKRRTQMMDTFMAKP